MTLNALKNQQILLPLLFNHCLRHYVFFVEILNFLSNTQIISDIYLDTILAVQPVEPSNDFT